MPFLLSIPILAFVVILQTAILSQMPLLYGASDLLLIVLAAWSVRPRVQAYWFWGIVAVGLMTFVSSQPLWVTAGSYGAVILLALYLRRRIWKVPLLVMFAVVFAGTLFSHLLSVINLWLTVSLPPVFDVFNQITLPSLLLNLVLALPVYVLFGDLADWLYPEELTV